MPAVQLDGFAMFRTCFTCCHGPHLSCKRVVVVICTTVFVCCLKSASHVYRGHCCLKSASHVYRGHCCLKSASHIYRGHCCLKSASHVYRGHCCLKSASHVYRGHDSQTEVSCMLSMRSHLSYMGNLCGPIVGTLDRLSVYSRHSPYLSLIRPAVTFTAFMS